MCAFARNTIALYKYTRPTSTTTTMTMHVPLALTRQLSRYRVHANGRRGFTLFTRTPSGREKNNKYHPRVATAISVITAIVASTVRPGRTRFERALANDGRSAGPGARCESQLLYTQMLRTTGFGGTSKFRYRVRTNRSRKRFGDVRTGAATVSHGTTASRRPITRSFACTRSRRNDETLRRTPDDEKT